MQNSRQVPISSLEQLITLALTRPDRAMENDYRPSFVVGSPGASDKRPMEGDKLASHGWRCPGRSRPSFDQFSYLYLVSNTAVKIKNRIKTWVNE